MPYRKNPIVANEIYHVFNRSVAKQPIFLSSWDYTRALEVLKFYQYHKPPLRFSFYNRLPTELKNKFINELSQSGNLNVEIICFCLMPNHVHFLIKNLKNDGIKKFMSNFQNSYAKYFNIKKDRSGALFQSMFKAVRIETDEQLVHISRYIHLNPVTSYLINPEGLKTYMWSSYSNYLNKGSSFLKKDLVLGFFKSPKYYERFVLDQADYQRDLDKIKHFAIE